MPGPADTLRPGETLVRTTKTTTYPKRGGWLPWLLGLLVIPALIALLVSYAPFGKRAAVQDDLADKSRQALSAAGVDGADVRMDGVVANVANVAPGQTDVARDAVESVDGVWSASVDGRGGDGEQNPVPPPTDSATTTPPAPAGPFGIAVKDGKVTLTGAVPDEETRAALVAAATQNAGGKPVDDQLTVDSGATAPVDAAQAGAVTAALGAGSASDRSVTWNGDTVTLAGSVATEQEKTAAGQAAAAAAPGKTIDNQLAVTAPPVDKQAVQQRITALLAGAPITFQPNSADLTPQGAQTVDQLAPLIKDVSVEIDGHVANTPGKALDAQVLSEQRAATVQARLVQLGVPADRITAKGFGDTKPVAPNNTPAGVAANRRVEIVVL